SLLQSGRIGLLTHSAAVTADLSRGVDALLAAGLDVRCLISPEHGYWGTGQAGDGHEDGHDQVSGLPVPDAYGEDADDLECPPDGQDISELVVGPQASRGRCYPYMRCTTDRRTARARPGPPVTVLDRPHPLASTALGPAADPRVASLVGR